MSEERIELHKYPTEVLPLLVFDSITKLCLYLRSLYFGAKIHLDISIYVALIFLISPFICCYIADAYLGYKAPYFYGLIGLVVTYFLYIIGVTEWCKFPTEIVAALHMSTTPFHALLITIFVPFVGTHFELPAQTSVLSKTIAWHWWLTEAVAPLISFLLLAFLPNFITCFEYDCYASLIYTSFILIGIVLVTYIITKWMYIEKKPRKNIFGKIYRVIKYAKKRKKSSTGPKKNLLDYAADKYSSAFLNDIRNYRFCFFVIPFSICQIAHYVVLIRWPEAIMKMDWNMSGGGLYIAVVQNIPTIITFFIFPLMELVLYPLSSANKWLTKIHHRLCIGTGFLIVSMILSGFVWKKLEENDIQLPKSGECLIRIYNAIDCNQEYSNELTNAPTKIEPMDLRSRYHYITGSTVIKCFITCGNLTGEIDMRIQEKKTYGLLLKKSGVISKFDDDATRHKAAKPMLRVLDSSDYVLNFELKGDDAKTKWDSTTIDKVTLNEGTYTLKINGTNIYKKKLLYGGVYVTLINALAKDKYRISHKILSHPNYVQLYWCIPQFICFAIGIIMLEVNMAKFSYFYAPRLFKATGFMTYTISNMLSFVIYLAASSKVRIFEKFSSNMFFYSGLLSFNLILIIILIILLRPSDFKEEPSEDTSDPYMYF